MQSLWIRRPIIHFAAAAIILVSNGWFQNLLLDFVQCVPTIGKGTHDTIGTGTHDKIGAGTHDTIGTGTHDTIGTGTHDTIGTGTQHNWCRYTCNSQVSVIMNLIAVVSFILRT